ncbi:g7105 [Coccomyxa viridis]|uniref:G7105 protein n=1 Tax=Coccomyxa viridis TaxID=1274662 RepID=A0ABP1G1X0_9CHLO
MQGQLQQLHGRTARLGENQVSQTAPISLHKRYEQRTASRSCTAPKAQARSAKAQAATSSNSSSLDWKRNSSQTPIDQLPEPDGDWSLPFIGETPEFKANHWEWARKRVKKYGPVFRSNIFGSDVVVVTDFIGLQKVFGGAHKLTQWMTAPSLEILCDGMLSASKEKASHQKQRRQQGAAFTPDAMDAYLPRVVATCEAYLQEWASQDSVNLVPAMGELSFDFAEGLVVGLGIQGEEKRILGAKWQEFTKGAITFTLDAPGTPFRRARKAKEYILAAIKDRVAEKTREFERGSVKKDTLLSFFASAKVDEGDPLNEPELAMNVLMFMLAGSDTSRDAHKVLLGILPQLPTAILDELRAEQRRIVEKHGPGYSRAAMGAMRYADALAREVLRIWGPADVLFRLAKEDFELHGKRIKKGSTILTSMLYAKASDPRMSAGDHELQSVPLHMDIHQLQASVKPERWLDPHNKLDMAALATFGMGPHSCLGAPLYMQEAKVLLAMIARGYDVSNATGEPVDWGMSPNAAGGSPAADVFLKFTPHQYV